MSFPGIDPEQAQLLFKTPARPGKPYDLAVIVGRFEPFHAGHGLLLNQALMSADHVLVLVGSSYLARTIKNPWSFLERQDMILGYCDQHDVKPGTISVLPITDSLYSDISWVLQVQDAVRSTLDRLIGPGWSDYKVGDRKVCIVGHKKDESSYYPDLFPQYETITIDKFPVPDLDATSIRNLMFSDATNLDLLRGLVPAYTLEFLRDFALTPEHDRLVREFAAIQSYKASWAAAPYPPTFVTVDAVVLKAGHVLMIRRKEAPGEGLWALPGGFINQGERIFDACLRELSEETNIDLPLGLLVAAVGKDERSLPRGRVFDAPGRSLRGRTITHAFLFGLDGVDVRPCLPTVRGDDDAVEAKWMSITEIKRTPEMIFEDHGSIITSLVGI